MPQYVIVEKRDFENLFEAVESNGSEITAKHAKAPNPPSKRSRVSLYRTDSSPQYCRKCTGCGHSARTHGNSGRNPSNKQHSESSTLAFTSVESSADSATRPATTDTTQFTGNSRGSSSTYKCLTGGIDYTSSSDTE